MRRIKLIAVALLAGCLALAGCGTNNNNGTPGSQDANSAASQDTNATPSGELDIFSWWTAGSEAEGLNALVGVLKQKYPDIEFVNGGTTSGGGSGKDALQARLDAGQPPDTFQVHAGKEAQDYIDADQLTDVSYLYDEFKLNDVFPTDLVVLLTAGGPLYTIPSNIHRANVVWASIPVLEKAGLSTTDAYYASTDDFIAALEKVKTAAPEVTPLAIGTTWTQVHLLETVLIGELGAKGYNGLFDGTTDWGSAEVTSALEKFQTLMSYTNTDRDGLDWEPPMQLVIGDTAACSIMGDWAPAAFDLANKVEGTDYLTAPTPGSKGIFDFLADSYGITNGAPHPANAKAWLDVISSSEGQIAFNKVKGSIPARTDIDLAAEGFSKYQQSASDSFKNDTIVPSIQHGAAMTIKQSNAINEAVSKFTTGGSDLATFQSELVAAAAS
jgi:glucose/mannose transport system substrate-binding protein